MESLRLSMGCANVSIQLLVPCRNPGIGNGYELRMPMPFGLSQFAGIMFPANGAPVSGSFTTRVLRKKGLDGESNSLKSPCRMAAEGTMPVLVLSCRKTTHS